MKTLLLKTVDFLNLYPLFYPFTKNTATIFMLHSIYPTGSVDGEITTGVLEKYFDYLKRNNYRVLSLSEYVEAFEKKQNTRKCVIFTVDDGYRDFYLNAFGVFKDYGYSAAIFITSDFIDKRQFMWWDTIEYAFQATKLIEVELEYIGNGVISLDGPTKRNDAIRLVLRHCKTLFNDDKLSLIKNLVQTLGVDISNQPCGKYEPLSWDEILEMHKHGIEFHPHTKTHPIIARVTMEQKMIELEEPKRIIEDRLKSKAHIFCYPNGQWEDFDEETISLLKKTGYKAAVTGMGGFDYTLKPVDYFRLRRFGIPHEFVLFKQYISGLENAKGKLFGGN
jgi:peptidoglycan/xylan/chitin deacetylase (PgdA/CDA1 family)